MKLRSRAGSEPVKTRRRKTLRPKRRNALNATSDRAPSAVDPQEQVDALSRELKEALARQTATSDILRVISQSPTDVQPVFDAIVLAAVRLLRCDNAFVLRCDSTRFWPAALAGPEGRLPVVETASGPIDPVANFT